MVNQTALLDEVFSALSSAVRRRTIEELGNGERTVSELSASHAMTLGGFMKHLRILTDAGLVSCSKHGRTVTCTLTEKPLTQASRWLAGREEILNDRMDALGRHLYHRAQVTTLSPALRNRKGVSE